MQSPSYPTYLAFTETGELARRARAAFALIERCRLCPRACEAERHLDRTGVCRTGRRAQVASYGPHHGEEDCLRGRHGSGTIFFTGCNLCCVFCQNWDISHAGHGREVSAEELAGMMLELQEQGCHNINWVTPTHVVPQVLEALAVAARAGLRLPIVYNSGGYDSVAALRLLDGVVDIYMPDFKVWDPDTAERLLLARDYPEVARAALKEMRRQVGDLVLDHDGLARRGLLLRHLVMPNDLAGTRPLAEWLARELSPHTYINLMAQYHPAGAVLEEREVPARFPDLRRRITRAEMAAAYAAARQAGLHRFDERWR